jgi:hypothetical protein
MPGARTDASSPANPQVWGLRFRCRAPGCFTEDHTHRRDSLERCRLAAKSGLAEPLATRRCSCRRSFWDRSLALALPRTDPAVDFSVRDAFAPVKRGNGALDASDPPFVRVEILVESLGCKKRSSASGALRQLFHAFLDLGLDADGEGYRWHGFQLS